MVNNPSHVAVGITDHGDGTYRCWLPIQAGPLGRTSTLTDQPILRQLHGDAVRDVLDPDLDQQHPDRLGHQYHHRPSRSCILTPFRDACRLSAGSINVLTDNGGR